jgi:hypothetical protein
MFALFSAGAVASASARRDLQHRYGRVGEAEFVALVVEHLVTRWAAIDLLALARRTFGFMYAAVAGRACPPIAKVLAEVTRHLTSPLRFLDRGLDPTPEPFSAAFLVSRQFSPSAFQQRF